MLKITLHDSFREFRFDLAGELAGPWVSELRQCWVTAASVTTGRETVVDLRAVDAIDSDGETLVAEMDRSGVVLLRREQNTGAGQSGFSFHQLGNIKFPHIELH